MTIQEKMKSAGWECETRNHTYLMEWFENLKGSCGIVLVPLGDGSHWRAVEWDEKGIDKSGRGLDLVAVKQEEVSE